MEQHQTTVDQTQKKMCEAAMIPPPSSSLHKQDATATTFSASQQTVAVANIKYRNDAGRQAVLSVANAVHYDFGSLSTILNVSIGQDDLKRLAADPNIVWVDGEGAVYFIQPPE